jgi:hypothetical protein
MIHSRVLIDREKIWSTNLMLLAGILASSIFISPLSAQSASPAPQLAPAGQAAQATPASRTAAVTKSAPAGPQNRYMPSVPRRELEYYGIFWGVDSLSVKAVESGELIRFSWHVLDSDKAKALSDKKIDPFLVFPDAHLKLVVPSLEKVGQLRQSSTPESGKTYWMAFSNQGRRVKRGDRVNVVIGQFHADGLVVQ